MHISTKEQKVASIIEISACMWPDFYHRFNISWKVIRRQLKSGLLSY